MQTRPNRTAPLKHHLKQLGPALVLATVVLGPGSLTLNTIAGSVYGYRLVWVPVTATIFMVLYTWMSARISLVTGQTLFQLTRRKYGPGLARVGGLFGFMAILAFQAGNSAAVGFAANALIDLDVRVWAVLLVLPALAFILLPNLYRKLELIVKIFVGLMIITFVGTLVLVGVRPDAALQGLIPTLPDTEALFLTLGMAATTFSIAAAVYQGYLVREKKWGADDLGADNLDALVGIGVLGGISTIILLTSAGALFGTGISVFTAREMAIQIEPLAGPIGFYLFTLGFFFASFSSLIVNPLIGATLLADGFGLDAAMDGRPVKQWAAVGLGVGLLVVLLFEGSPVELLRVAQAFAVVAFPVLGLLILSIARDRPLMGGHVVRPWVQVLAAIGYLAILGIVLTYLRQIAATLF